MLQVNLQHLTENSMTNIAYSKFLDDTPQEAEFVYVLTSKYAPGLIKIGRTKRKPHERCRELNGQTGVANDHWKVSYAVGTLDSHGLEHRLHRQFADKACGGEVFKLRFVDVVRAFREHKVLTVYNSDDQEAEKRAREEVQTRQAKVEEQRVEAQRLAVKEAAKRVEAERLAAIEQSKQMEVNTMAHYERTLNEPVSVGDVVTTVLGSLVGGFIGGIVAPGETINEFKKMGAPWKKGFWKNIDTDQVKTIQKFTEQHPAEMQREQERLQREAIERQVKKLK